MHILDSKEKMTLCVSSWIYLLCSVSLKNVDAGGKLQHCFHKQTVAIDSNSSQNWKAAKNETTY